jgi:hypothetical protein
MASLDAARGITGLPDCVSTLRDAALQRIGTIPFI